MNQQIHPHPDLLPAREKELRFVIRIGAFRREDLTNQIRHCEERSDVAISTGSSLLFFFLAPSPPLALSPSVFKGVRISSFIFYSKENNL